MDDTASSPASQSKAIDRQSVSRRRFLTGSAGAAIGLTALGGALAACGSGASGKGEVVVLSWESYVAKEILTGFEKATGIKVKGVAAESDQDMFAKIKAGGGSQYDIVFGNCGWAPTYHQNDLTEVLDLSEIPASKDLFPVFTEDPSLPYVVSPGKVLLYPNMWAALSLAWNLDAPYQPGTPLSWNALWEAPKNKAILEGGAEDFIALAGLANGVPRKDIYAMQGPTLDAAAAKLGSLKPFQISKNSDDAIARALANQGAYIGFASSLGMAQRANSQFGQGKDVVKAEVPTEGSIGWIDGPQLVKNAKNRDNAMTFINYFGGDVANQDYLWGANFYSQCSRVSTDRVIAAGGDGAVIAKSLGSDRPDLAKQLVFQAQPQHADAWAAAYDKVMG